MALVRGVMAASTDVGIHRERLGIDIHHDGRKPQ